MWQELRDAQQAVAEHVVPAIVGIGRGGGRGCGVVVGPNRLVTNAHNLRGEEFTVTFVDGRVATASVRGADVDADLAVLEVDTGETAAIGWADGPASVGDPVFAVTNPGGRGARVTFGTVSSVGREFRGPRGRRISGSLEHTAPLPRGSSGSPIVDPAGRMVGLSTNRLGEGFYLAMPTDEALRGRVEALGRGEAPRRLRLGIGLVPSRAARHLRASVGLPEREGLLVRVVEDGSPASAAGMRQGDLITSVGGQQIGSSDDLFDLLDRHDPATPLTVTVVRGAEEHELTVRFDAG